MREVYIVGAHSRGRTLKKYLETLDSDTKVCAFLVDDISDNHSMEDGVPVLEIAEGAFDVTHPVYIGTRGVFHDKVTKELSELGVRTIIPVTVELDIELRNQFVEKRFLQQGRQFLKFDQLEADEGAPQTDLKCATIYVASSIFDATLQTSYAYLPEEKRIQVGCALADERIADCGFFDNDGDNISEKNRQYCELTALYWIWKNAKEDIVGLVHYRRHFLLPEHWAQIMQQDGIDVILPVPLYVSPSLAENYKERHTASDWECMMSVLGEMVPQMLPAAQEFFSDGLYSPCNMLIARKDVLCALCAWMFPILDQVVAICGTHDDNYQNRYPGFMSERLMSFYFSYYSDQYKVVYADKNFLQ